MQHQERYPQNGAENAPGSFGQTAIFLPEDLETKPPFVVEVEENCEECGGSGYDCGSLRPMDPDECPVCCGTGMQIVVHNYLAEALRIAGGKSSMPLHRKHLEAVIQHCRDLVAAVISLAEVP